MSESAPKLATPREAVFSFVNEIPPAEPARAHRHFLAKLAFETDPYDVNEDLKRGRRDVVVLDVRSPQAYAERHVAGSINFPYRTMNAETTADLPRDKTLVVYCWGPACNASTKAAARLAELGFPVKEMIGGIEYWFNQGFPVEGTLPPDVVKYG